ncbi:hypothetical protein [Microbacterium sp. P04]|uniref:hypothetical protein n=1 Tax=Microbacterium sp. P04 TaxID=3366947 RepID=UPI0037459E2D
MDLNDPNLPKAANEWALIGADQIRAWGMSLEQDPETDPITSLALTLLAVVEAQARIIGDLASRMDSLEQ